MATTSAVRTAWLATAPAGQIGALSGGFTERLHRPVGAAPVGLWPDSGNWRFWLEANCVKKPPTPAWAGPAARKPTAGIILEAGEMLFRIPRLIFTRPKNGGGTLRLSIFAAPDGATPKAQNIRVQTGGPLWFEKRSNASAPV